MYQSDSVKEISKALLKAQKAMGDAVKDAKNPFFKSSYADLNAIREVAIPVLNASGVSVLQPMEFHGDKCFVVTLLLHESGEFLKSLTPVVQAKANDPQSFGAGVTYARRFGLQSMCNVGAVDDDCESQYDRKTNTPQAPRLDATVITFGTTYKGFSFAAVGKPKLKEYLSTVLKKYPDATKAPDEINQFIGQAEAWLNG